MDTFQHTILIAFSEWDNVTLEREVGYVVVTNYPAHC